jgi:hypothetical protein
MWASLGLVLFLIGLAISLGVLYPATKRARAAAERDIAAAGPDGEIAFSQEFLEASALPRKLGPLLSLIAIVIVFLMEAKPF